MNKKMITALTVAGLATFAMAENASADTYTVQSGDTLSQIAANHNTTVDTLVANNDIADANVIFVGQQVEIDGVASNASYDATQADVAAVVASQAPVTQQVSYTAPVTTVDYSAQSQAPVAQEVSYTAPVATTTTTAAASGSTYDQFIAAGGTAALWNAIVLPESGGNPNAVSPNGYRGLGQTKQAWGTGSVAQQTAGLVNYAVSRYGSIDGAIQFRLANGWW